MKMTRREMMRLGATGTAGIAAPSIGNAADTSVAASPVPWMQRRKEIVRHWLDLLGDFPAEIPPLKPEMKKVEEKDGITRYHVSFQSEPEDRVTAWLLVPDVARKQPTPAIICIHSTTFGTGKDRTAGLAGTNIGDPPEKPEVSRAYGRELAGWGYVTLCIDLLCDGERVAKSGQVLDSSEFYRRHPHWSIVGKGNWDVQRSVDFLQTLDFVDAKRIGCVGHSLGGHQTMFAAAFEPRLAASVVNGVVLNWMRTTPHWARPEGHDSAAEVQQALGYKPAAKIGVYTYIKRFRPYIEDQNKEIPVDFDSLLMLVAPRALLVMGNEYEFGGLRNAAQCARAFEVYRDWQDGEDLPSVIVAREESPGHARTLEAYKSYTPEKVSKDFYGRLGAVDRFTWFTYPGPHGYPPAAKRFSFAWFDRWFAHTPAVPSIWPGENI